MALRSVFEYTIDLTGAATTNVELPALDLSRARALRGFLKITSAATAAGDTLDIRFQETHDQVVWDTRWRHTVQVGNSGASGTAPETETIVLLCRGYPEQANERVWEETGSGGSSDLSAGTVRNGPLARRVRRGTKIAVAPYGAVEPSHRVQFVVTSASAPVFAGSYLIEADTGDA